MKSVMEMRIDTIWGNAVTLRVESELDNTHDLTTTDLTRLQVFTLSLMVAEVRREGERQLGVARTVEEGARERDRYGEMEAAHESDRRIHDVRRAVEADAELERQQQQGEGATHGRQP